MKERFGSRSSPAPFLDDWNTPLAVCGMIFPFSRGSGKIAFRACGFLFVFWGYERHG
jgi:hypothetical protein